MNRKDVKRIFRSLFPDSPFLRKVFTKGQIWLLKRHLLSEQEIAAGESSAAEKQRIVETYRRKWKRYVLPKENSARKVLREAPCYRGRNDCEEIFTDMIFCYLAYGFYPSEYCYFGLVDKSAAERKEFVSELYKKIFKFTANEFDDQTFANKYLAYERLKEYYGRDAAVLKGAQDYPVFADFVKKHPVFVKKLVDGTCGRSVELMDANTYSNDMKALFNTIISQGEVILEEKVVQTEIMAAFNSSSINTVRCITITTRNGIIAPFGFLRTGRAGTFVDNAGSGGIFAALDMAGGKVMADGCDELGNHYKNHPDSGVQYAGFELPDWEQAIALCKEAAQKVPRNKYIGWDLAHTAKGWLIIEGNTAAQLVQQGSLQKGIRPELDAIMKDMDLITSA